MAAWITAAAFCRAHKVQTRDVARENEKSAKDRKWKEYVATSQEASVPVSVVVHSVTLISEVFAILTLILVCWRWVAADSIVQSAVMCCHLESMPLFRIILSTSGLVVVSKTKNQCVDACNPSRPAHLWGGPGSHWRMRLLLLSKPREGKVPQRAGQGADWQLLCRPAFTRLH